MHLFSKKHARLAASTLPPPMSIKPSNHFSLEPWLNCLKKVKSTERIGKIAVRTTQPRIVTVGISTRNGGRKKLARKYTGRLNAARAVPQTEKRSCQKDEDRASADAA